MGEIYSQGNGWLTYSPLLHRIREGGTFVKLFDLLDERQLTPTEVSLFTQLLLRREGDAPMPRTAVEFCKALRGAVYEAPGLQPSHWPDGSTGGRLARVQGGGPT